MNISTLIYFLKLTNKIRIMKKKSITLLIVVIIVLIFSTGCERLHRGQYTGTWEFLVILEIWDQGSGLKYDTTHYLGKISRDIVYNKLKIEYLKDTKITMEVNECGELNKDFDDPYEFAFGQFYGNDYVQIKLGWKALGGGYSYFIEGIKKGGRKK